MFFGEVQWVVDFIWFGLQNWAVQKYISLGAPKDKLIMGVAFYGRSFTLCSATNNKIGDSICGAGTQGPYTKEAGYTSYFEVLDTIFLHCHISHIVLKYYLNIYISDHVY